MAVSVLVAGLATHAGVEHVHAPPPLPDGNGTPARGLADVVIEGNTIAEVVWLDPVAVKGGRARRPAADAEIDATGKFVLPGLINVHAHVQDSRGGVPQPVEYALKTWLATGITTVREVGNDSVAKLLALRERAARGEVASPRIFVYAMFNNRPMPRTPNAARARVQEYKRMGADGMKMLGVERDLMGAALDEAHRLGLRVAHHAGVEETDAWDDARFGTTSVEHWYGIPDAAIPDRQQRFPSDYNYHDETDRFRWAGHLWREADPAILSRVLDTLVAAKVAWVPTLDIYEASRDLQRAQTQPWFREWLHPTLEAYFKPDAGNHGSYFFGWSSTDETAWKENYRIWMAALREFDRKGGLIGVGDDAGFIYPTRHQMLATVAMPMRTPEPWVPLPVVVAVAPGAHQHVGERAAAHLGRRCPVAEAEHQLGDAGGLQQLPQLLAERADLHRLVQEGGREPAGGGTQEDVLQRLARGEPVLRFIARRTERGEKGCVEGETVVARGARPAPRGETGEQHVEGTEPARHSQRGGGHAVRRALVRAHPLRQLVAEAGIAPVRPVAAGHQASQGRARIVANDLERGPLDPRCLHQCRHEWVRRRVAAELAAHGAPHRDRVEELPFLSRGQVRAAKPHDREQVRTRRIGEAGHEWHASMTEHRQPQGVQGRPAADHQLPIIGVCDGERAGAIGPELEQVVVQAEAPWLGVVPARRAHGMPHRRGEQRFTGTDGGHDVSGGWPHQHIAGAP